MKNCENLVSQTLEFFCRGLVERAQDGAVGVDDIQEFKSIFMNSQPSLWLNDHAEFCRTEHEDEVHQRMRSDHLFRLITREFSRAIRPDGIQRAHVRRIRLALSMMIGDRFVAEYQVACNDIMSELARSGSEQSLWSRFYDDSRSEHILSCCLTLIADRFVGRFDARRAWFLKFMESDLLDMSLGPHSFVSQGAPRSTPFTERHFAILFKALFARHDPALMAPATRAAIVGETACDPVPTIGFLQEQVNGMNP